MLKRFKSVSMMLFLAGASGGTAPALPVQGIDEVEMAQQDGYHHR